MFLYYINYFLFTQYKNYDKIKLMNKYYNRNTFLDAYKGFLMILVIIGHLTYFNYEDKFITLIYSFHMPAFLIISGILTKNKQNTNILNIIKQRFISCIIPYFIFYFISYIIIPQNDITTTIFSLKSTFSGVADSNYSINLPLWYLTFFFVNITTFEIILYISNIISSKFKKNKKHNKSYIINEIIIMIFILILTVISFIYSRILKLDRLVYNIEIALICLPFTYIGHLIKIIIPNIKNYLEEHKGYNQKIYILSIIIFIISFIVWFKLSLINKRIDLNARNFRHINLMYINAILGFFIFSVFVFFLNKIKYIKQMLRIIGQNSIYILAYHIPSVFYMNILFNDFMPKFVIDSLNTANFISILYKVCISIIFSLFMRCIHIYMYNYIKKIDS